MQLPLVHHASVGIEVKFRDFAALSRWVGQHVANTDGFRVSHVEWALTSKRRTELQRQVRTRAVEDAVLRAQQYADALGLGKIRPVAIADAGMLGASLHPGGRCRSRPPARGARLPAGGAGRRTAAGAHRGVGGGRRAVRRRGRRGTRRSVCVMAELKDRLRADLTAAMKSQDRLRTATLRMLLSAIQTEEVSGKQSRELSDDDVLKVLARESKKRGESAEIYTQNGRGELAANEHAEARIIDEYLPTPLTEAELADVVDTAIAQVAEETGEAPGMKQMGQVMKAATAIAAGKADGARLSAAVKARL